MRCNLRTVNSSIRTVCAIHGPRTDRKKDISLLQRGWNVLSPTNDMQFTDRELFYTDRIWSSRSVRTERSVRKISPLITRMKYSKFHKWDAINETWTLLYGPYLKFTVRKKDISLSQRALSSAEPSYSRALGKKHSRRAEAGKREN